MFFTWHWDNFVEITIDVSILSGLVRSSFVLDGTMEKVVLGATEKFCLIKFHTCYWAQMKMMATHSIRVVSLAV